MLDDVAHGRISPAVINAHVASGGHEPAFSASALDARCLAAYRFNMASSPLAREDIADAVRAMLGADSASNSGLPDDASIVAVYLYGSCARGTAGASSDVDLGLLYAAPPASTLLAQPFLIEAELAEQIGRAVQCVVMNTAPVDLVHRIFVDGMLLVDTNPAYRIRFEIDARNRYFDLKPMLDRYRRGRHVA